MKCRVKEDGFASLWIAFTLAGTMLVGLTFILFTQVHISKLRSQFLAMNLAIVGNYSSEFDSNESLNNMALLAHVMGYQNAEPIKDHWQRFSLGGLQFQHETDPNTGKLGVGAFVYLNQKNILGGTVAYLTDTDITSFVRTRSSPVYLKLTFDYSNSIAGDSIDNLLQNYGVIDSTGAAGPNGRPVGGVVVPTEEIQTAMPFAWDPWTRTLRPWSEKTTAYPSVPVTTAIGGCIPTAESGCQVYQTVIQSHQNVLLHKYSDLFAEYKKANVLLTGAVGQTTPHLDVDVLCGMFNTDFYDALVNKLDPGIFPMGSNNGVCEAWKYDDMEFGALSVNGSGQITSTVIGSHTVDNPLNIFEDPPLMSPNRVLQYFMDLTFYRKLARYGTVLSNDGVTVVSSPEQYSGALEPSLPKLSSPLAPDAFPYDVAPLANTTYLESVIADPVAPFGWPSRPHPIFSPVGKAYPRTIDLPPEIRYPHEYNCGTGPPRMQNYPMSADILNPGNFLCHIYNQCHPSSSVNCSVPAEVNPIKDTYFDPFQNDTKSPNCAGDINEVPKCYSDPTRTILSTTSNVFCLNGVARCFPNMLHFPACASGAVQCLQYPISAPYTPASYNLASSPVVPAGHTTSPVPRGKVSFPSGAAPILKGDIFRLLNDLSPFGSGTHTHNAVPVTRCKDYKALHDDASCAWVLVTDGQPYPVNADGTFVVSQAQALNTLSTEMDKFVDEEGGKTFTWFLGAKPSQLANLTTTLSAMSLSSPCDTIFDGYIDQGLHIPAVDCAAWDSCRPTGIPDCSIINTWITDEANQAAVYSQFKTIMSSGSNRLFVESSIQSTVAGTDPSVEFIEGLVELLSRLKREADIHH